MQVQKYKLGEVVWTKNGNDEYRAWANNSFHEMPLSLLKLLGATPLIEKEAEMLEEDPEKILSEITYKKQTWDWRIAQLFAKHARAINALKGVK